MACTRVLEFFVPGLDDLAKAYSFKKISAVKANPLTPIKWIYSAASLRTSLNMKPLKPGVFWGDTALSCFHVISHLLLVILGERRFIVMDLSGVLLLYFYSDWNSWICFDSELSLSLGSQGSWLIKNAKVGGAANIFHFSWYSCVGFFLDFCHRLLGYFGKKLFKYLFT